MANELKGIRKLARKPTIIAVNIITAARAAARACSRSSITNAKLFRA